MNTNDIIEKCARVCDRMVTEHETLGFHAAADIYKNSALQIRALKSTPCPKGGDANEPASALSKPGLDKSSPGVTAGASPAETVSDAMVESLRNIRRAIAEDTTALNDTLWMPDDVPSSKGASVLDYIDQTLEAAALAHADDGWRPIESAPKDGTTILVSFGTRGVHAVAWCEPSAFDHEIWCVDDGKHGPYALRGWNEKPSPTAPTHWRPLPASPKDGME